MLSESALSGFAVACVERSLPAYERRTGARWSPVHNAVALAWHTMEGASISGLRWMRVRAMITRSMLGIETYGPDVQTNNSVAASARLLTEIFGYSGSGDPSVDRRERAERAAWIAHDVRDTIDSMIREETSLGSAEWDGSENVEGEWQEALLDALSAATASKLSRPWFESIDLGDARWGRGLSSKDSRWFPWERSPPAEGPPDATLFLAGISKSPKIKYHIYAASESTKPDGRTQVVGAEVLEIPEMVRVENQARISYYVRDESVFDWAEYLIEHLLLGELLMHRMDSCETVRFRNIDLMSKRVIPYPPHSLSEEDA